MALAVLDKRHVFVMALAILEKRHVDNAAPFEFAPARGAAPER